MSFDLPSAKEVLHGLSELGQGVFYGAIEMPIDGITQLFNHISPVDLPPLELVDPEQHDSALFKVGVAGGVALDTVLLSAGVNRTLAGFAKANPATAPFLKTGIQAVALSAMQPIPEGSNYWLDKGLSTGVRMATMQAGTGINKLVGDSGLFGTATNRTLVQEVAYRGLTGLPKGVLSAQIGSIAAGRGFAGPIESLSSAGKSSLNAIAGGTLSELFKQFELFEKFENFENFEKFGGDKKDEPAAIVPKS